MPSLASPPSNYSLVDCLMSFPPSPSQISLPHLPNLPMPQQLPQISCLAWNAPSSKHKTRSVLPKWTKLRMQTGTVLPKLSINKVTVSIYLCSIADVNIYSEGSIVLLSSRRSMMGLIPSFKHGLRPPSISWTCTHTCISSRCFMLHC